MGNGVYENNYKGDKQRGFVTSDNSVLAQHWYGKARYEFRNGWKWGSTPYEEGDHSFANCKLARWWNPGPTKENVFVEFSGYEDNGIFKFVVENADGEAELTERFGSNLKFVLREGTTHDLAFEFRDSDQYVDNGRFRMWLDGAMIKEISGFRSRTDGGLKRFYILGLENEWGSNAANTLRLSNIAMYENKNRDQVELKKPVPKTTPKSK